MSIVTGKRVFSYNGKTLPDPDPTIPAEKAVKLYQDQYPELVNATLGEPDVNPQDGTVTYAVNPRTGRAG